MARGLMSVPAGCTAAALFFSKQGPHPITLDADLHVFLSGLLSIPPLESCHSHHALNSAWKDQRNDHIKSDVVIFYKPETGSLRVVHPDSHRELGAWLSIKCH
ncbi:MAG TPA: type II toxin-antitoxin system YafQ family toxin [Xylella sp.]